MPKKFKTLQEYSGQRSANPYPDEDMDPAKKKEQDYYIKYGHAMIADWVNNACELPFSFPEGKRTFRELHQYATGTYSNAKLKDNVIGTTKTKKKNGKWITKMNISWDTLPVMAKMFDVMREKNMRQDYDVDAMCIDDDSIQAKAADKDMLKYLVNEETVELMRRTKFKPNTKIDPQALGMQNEQDVDLYFECGAYVFERELATIAACNKTKLVSNYKVVQDGTFDDFIKYGIAVWRNEIDPSTDTVKIRKCTVYDPEYDVCPIIIPYSQSNSFDNISRCGEVRPMTISDLRRENPHLTAEDLIYIAQCYKELNTDFSKYLNGYNFYNSETGLYNLDPINRCKILVLDFQFLGVDIENYEKNESRTHFKEKDFSYKITSDRRRKGYQQIQKKVVKKHGAKWVIGSDILLKYGASEDIIYYGPDGDRCPGLDFFAAKTGNGSLIERGIAIQDDIDFANIKLRSVLSSAIPAPRMVVQQGLLDNVFMNNIKVEPQDNMATFRELGYLIVNAVDDDGKPIFTNQKLVDFQQMGIAEDVNVFSGQIMAGINNLREVFGLAQGADGSTPQKYDGFKKTALSQQSSNAALYPTFNSFQYLFENAFTDVGKKWQIIAKDRDIKLAYSPLGQKNLKILSLDKEFTNADLNISLVLGATDDQINDLLKDIKDLRALGIQTNFNQGITTSEFLYLNETIRSGNTKQAMWVMAKVEQKKIAAQKVIDQQNQQNNEASQQNSAAATELNKQKTVQIKGREDRLTMVLDGALKMKTAVSSAMINTYDAEKDPPPTQLYQKMIDDADAEIVGILQQDMAQVPGQQGGQPGQPPEDGQQQLPQQQVA